MTEAREIGAIADWLESELRHSMSHEISWSQSKRTAALALIADWRARKALLRQAYERMECFDEDCEEFRSKLKESSDP